MEINYNNNNKNIIIYIFVVLLILLESNKLIIHNVNGLSGCETLSSELCLSAYPVCMSLILTSCCPGQTALCLDIDNVINYATNKELKIQSCLKNIESGVLYEVWGELFPIPGFEILPLPNTTCKDLACETKGFDCVYEPVADCISGSVCCQPQPACTNFLKSINFNISMGRDNCFLECQDGFVCSTVVDKKVCVPTSCDLIECPDGTECLPIEGIGIVSCYKVIEPSPITNKTCEDISCPEGLICGGSHSSPFSNATCLPDNLDVLGNSFDCSECPDGFICKKFGWSGLCIEDQSFDYQNDIECFGSNCLSNQFCNSTAKQCEYQRCTNTTCGNETRCYQYHPQSPRVCAAINIFPTFQYPLTPIFRELFNDTH